ncbi:MAG TPA: ATP:cob(I)alamin adenosyltransferase, partial [Ktedonobacterales bacterium]|nr:ATP:cob(I)alamin adenosyltransferase [Ktedonobacterales bacterium]
MSRFILPGDTRAGATLDFARATVRRAERAVSQLFHADGGDGLANGEALRYLNRLSDLLFVLARGAEAGEGGSTPARLHEPEPEPVQ